MKKILFILSLLINTYMPQSIDGQEVNNEIFELNQKVNDIKLNKGCIDTAYSEYFIDVDLDKIVDQFTNEYAYFKSNLEYNSFMKKFSVLDFERKSQLLQKLKYRSFEQHVNELFEELNQIRSEDNFTEFIKLNADYIDVYENDKGEKELKCRDESFHMIAPFLNVNRNVKIGNSFIKYIAKVCVISDDITELNSIKGRGDIHGKVLKVEKAVDLVTIPDQDQDINPRTNENDLFIPYDWEIDNGEYYCKKRRKVLFTAVAAASYYSELIIGGVPVIIYELEKRVLVKAKRQNILCYWYPYSTYITWNNYSDKYSFGLPGYIGNYFSGFPDTYIYASSITRRKNLGTYSSANEPYFHWDKIFTNITTEDLSPEWLNIDYPE